MKVLIVDFIKRNHKYNIDDVLIGPFHAFWTDNHSNACFIGTHFHRVWYCDIHKRSRHWRYFYQLHKEGKLEAEYERVIGSAYFEALRKDGFIIPDVTIPNFFKRLKPDI